MNEQQANETTAPGDTTQVDADRERSKLCEILSQRDGTCDGSRRCWRDLRDWGIPRFLSHSLSSQARPDFHRLAAVSKRYPDLRAAVELEWLREFADATRDLLPQVENLGRGSLDEEKIDLLEEVLKKVLSRDRKDDPEEEEREFGALLKKVDEGLEGIELLLRKVQRPERRDAGKDATVPDPLNDIDLAIARVVYDAGCPTSHGSIAVAVKGYLGSELSKSAIKNHFWEDKKDNRFLHTVTRKADRGTGRVMTDIGLDWMKQKGHPKGSTSSAATPDPT
jgi:hypothetical protein